MLSWLALFARSSASKDAEILRALKLGQMLPPLPDRLTLARQQKMTHADFLELVILGLQPGLAEEAARAIDAAAAAARGRFEPQEPSMRLIAAVAAAGDLAQAETLAQAFPCEVAESLRQIAARTRRSRLLPLPAAPQILTRRPRPGTTTQMHDAGRRLPADVTCRLSSGGMRSAAKRLSRLGPSSDIPGRHDADDNRATRIPGGEQVRVPAIWLIELYTPTTLDGLVSGLPRLVRHGAAAASWSRPARSPARGGLPPSMQLLHVSAIEF